MRKKAVAQEMVDLIRTIEELDFLRPQLLVGRRLHSDPRAQVSAHKLPALIQVLNRAQMNLFELLASGSCNLIIATKRAEDLEFPPATIVVR